MSELVRHTAIWQLCGDADSRPHDPSRLYADRPTSQNHSTPDAPSTSFSPVNGRVVGVVAVSIAGALLISFLIGMRVQELRAQNGTQLPPIQAVVYVYLDDREFFDKTYEQAYARDLAAQYEARFIRPGNRGGWPRDLRVTTEAPPCLYGRRCPTTHKWPFQIRSAEHIDPVAARIALGSGNLTMRSIAGAKTSACQHAPLVYEGAAVAEPFIPESSASNSCLPLGPVIRKLETPGYVGSFSSSSTTSTILQLYIDDSTWLVTYAQSHRAENVAVLMDNWVVGTVDPKVAIDHGLTAPNQPFVFQSVDMSNSMASAIGTAVGAAEPLVQEPVQS